MPSSISALQVHSFLSSLKDLIVYFYMHICVPECIYIHHMHSGSLWRSECIGSPGVLELQVVVSNLMWVLETEPRSSVRVLSAHNH